MANTEQVIIKRIQIRRDTLANWLAVDPILADGEIGYIKDSNNIKIGNGVNKFSQIENLNQEDSQILLQHINNKENPHEVTKAQVGLGNVDNTSDIDKPVSVAIQSALNNKVDKITGKGLSEDDFTTAEKTKLSGIATNANNYTHPNHTGDVTSTGDGATAITDNVVSNSKLSDVPTETIKGRVTADSGDPEDLTISQVRTLLSINNLDNTSDANKPISSATQDALDDKVDKVTGKQLSTNDYTTTEKDKLAGIEEGAEVNVNTNISQGTRTTTTVPIISSTGTDATLEVATSTLAGVMSADDKIKLDAIEAGAEVNIDTNLSQGTKTATEIPLLSSTGTGTTLPSATTTEAGLMSATDKEKLNASITNSTDTFTSTTKVEHVVTLTQAEYDGITPEEDTIYIITDGVTNSEDIVYDNSDAELNSTNVKSAIDELSLTKVDVGALSSNINLFYTNTASDVSPYNKVVSSIEDAAYNTTAVNIPTGTITTNGQALGVFIADANLFVGNPGIINITTVGNIRKIGGNSNQFAEFYFQIYKRASNGTETLLVTSDTTGSVNPASNNYLEFSAMALLNNGSFLATDRLVFKFFANLVGNSGSSYEFQFGGTTPVRTLLPVPVSVIPAPLASAIITDTTNFNGKLSSSNTNVQSALETLDDHGHAISEISNLQTALNNKLETSLKGSNNGLAELDSGGKVPSTQLPSYVDDVLEYADLASFPATGETGKIYLALDTNIIYRWGGSNYVEISQSLALGETSSTAYRGDRGKTAYDHSQVTGNPHNTTKSDVGLSNVDNTSDVNKPVSTAQQTALNAKASIINSSFTGIQVVTQAEYDAIPSPVSTVIYFIKDV